MHAKFPATQYMGENWKKKTFSLIKATQKPSLSSSYTIQLQYSTNSVHLHVVGSSNSTLTLLQSAAVHPPSWQQDCTILDRKNKTVMLDWLLLTDNYHFAAYVDTHPKHISKLESKVFLAEIVIKHMCLI